MSPELPTGPTRIAQASTEKDELPPASPKAGTPDPSETICEPCCPPSCGWYVRARNLWLWRDQSERVFLGQENDLSTGEVVSVLTTDAVDFDYRPGFRLTVGYQLDESFALEGSYFGLHHWSESAVLANSNLLTNSLFSPYLFFGALSDAYLFNYDSEIHNAELNCRKVLPCCCTASVLCGIRFINLNEDFDLIAVGSTFNDFERTAVRTDNNLIGLQVGGELTHAISCRSAASVYGKAGVFLNFADQNITNDRDDGVGDGLLNRLDAGDDGVAAASLVELGFKLTYCIHQNITISGGYTVIFLNGLALAPEQLGSTNLDIATLPQTIDPGRSGATLNDEGSMILHGPFAGVEISWGGFR